MAILKHYTALFFLVALSACGTQKKPVKEKRFIVDVKSIKVDTVITHAIYFENFIICLQQDHKILVLDTTLDHDTILTNKLSNLKVLSLLSLNDTVLIETHKKFFSVEKDFSIKNYNQQSLRYYLQDYIDSSYYVYSCSVGEFGAAVFFLQKKTNKIYSYPATGVQQVLKFRDTYVVSNFLAHLSGFSDYLFIKDPTQLYELKSESQKTYCNWYLHDTIKGIKQFDTVTPPGVKYFSESFTTRTLTTFPYKEELYSIYVRIQQLFLLNIRTRNL